MHEFKFIDKTTASILAQYYKNCSYKNCKYSVGTKCFWYKYYPYEYCIISDCLVVKYVSEGKTFFDFPVSGSDGNINKALDFIDSFCIEHEIQPVFSYVPSEYVHILADRYCHIRFDSLRSTQDYIYKAEDLKDFNGRIYSSHRNHINQFKKQHPDYIFRELTPDDDLSCFFEEYKKEYGQMDKSALEEFEMAQDMASSLDCEGLFGGCIETEGKIAAFSIGEITKDTIIIHIEKGLYSYKGVYPVIVSEFLKHFASEDVVYVNREEDDGEKGLRISKMHYRPCFMAKKIVASITNELTGIDCNTQIKTDRLTLDCRNNGNTRLDFDVDFNGNLIGRVVAFKPDYRGSVEIECNIISEYNNQGFEKEVIKVFSDWVLYNLDINCVKAKCSKQNTAESEILSSLMSKYREDETFYYFERKI